MKPHLVIICGILYPNPSPTGFCAFRYGTLLNEYYDIEFISLSDNGVSEEVTFDNYPVHTLASKRMKLESNTKGILNKAIHLLGSVQLKLHMLGNLRWYRKAVLRKLEQINIKRKIDAVLSVCSPFSAHQASADFKLAHPEIRFCAYTVDPFASFNRVLPFFYNMTDLVRCEHDVSSKADCLFLSEEAFNTRSDIYGDLTNKCILPYLMPNFNDAGAEFDVSGTVNCVYAGSFYKDIRNPEYMLKVFAALPNNIILHLYSSGCDDIVQNYSMRYPNIKVYGYVSREKLQKIYASSDFLIGVGNSMKDFLPSKTYEYLALRRPIIFFNPKGFENEVLSKYPHSLQIMDDMNVRNAVIRFEKFIASEHGKTITKEELYNIYEENTPAFVQDVLIKGLKGI